MELYERGPVNLEFELEEYKQVLEERRFVMTRCMQAIGLYLALSGFAVKQLLDARSPVLLCLLAVILTLLNGVAVWAAGRFRSMATQAMSRESYFVQRYNLQQMHSLFWGYYGAWLLVVVDQVAVLCVVLWRFSSPSSAWMT